MSAKRYTHQQINKSLSKPFLLYIFALPFILSVIMALFALNIKAFIFNGLGMVLYMGVLYLSNKGFSQENIYHQSILAKAPKIPYKLLSALLLSIVVFYTSFMISHKSLIESLFVSMVSLLGYYLYYGFDPKGDKLKNFGDISSEFVLQTIQEASSKLEFIENSLVDIKRYSLKAKVDNAINISKEILYTIQEDPKDIRVARKFLMVYLDGIKDVLVSYKELDSKDITDETYIRLEELFDEIQNKFDSELDRLKKNNQFDLDVNIDTLKTQINN
jgi:5-bromo-4-chloroindolyl phosphate hydrolysis protein